MRRYAKFVSLRMDIMLYDRVQRAADKANIGMSEWIRQAAVDRLNKERGFVK